MLLGHSCRGRTRRVRCTDSGPVVIYGPPTSLLPSGDGTSRRGPSEGTWRRRWAGATSSRGAIGSVIRSKHPYPTYGGVGTASGGLQGAHRLAYDPGVVSNTREGKGLIGRASPVAVRIRLMAFIPDLFIRIFHYSCIKVILLTRYSSERTEDAAECCVE